MSQKLKELEIFTESWRVIDRYNSNLGESYEE